MRPGRVAWLLFGSGLAALVLQTAWLRELRLVFGASTAASSAVLAIFMGGLGVGGWWWGRRVDRSRAPLALYGALELAVAVSAAITPLTLAAVRAAYIGLGGSETLGATGGTLVRLLLSALVLAAPTFCMGGTLPAAARAVADAGDPGRRGLALLYGANTLGAVAGVLVATFVLLERFGNRRTLWAGCAVAALAGLAARAWSRRADPLQSEAASAPGARAVAATVRPTAPTRAGLPPRAVLVLAAAVGFVFLLLELVWYRMLSPLLGGSTFTFGLILAVALGGIGAGGLFYTFVFARCRPSALALAIVTGGEALAVALPYALGDRIALAAFALHDGAPQQFAALAGGWALVAAAVVFPAAFASGVQFPLLVALLGEGEEAIGEQIGAAYLWNTAGSLAGSLAGGFGLLPLATAPGAWRGAAALLAAMALAVGVSALGARAPRRRAYLALLPAAVALALLLPVAASGPSSAWRHSGIGAGRAGGYPADPNAVRSWLNDQRRTLRWEADGVESSIGLVGATGYAFYVNGKSDGHARGDAGTQVMGGLLGALLHREPKSALVIGLGTGSSAGWLAAVGSIERVDVVELEPAIVEVARRSAAVNRDVLDDPKVHLVMGDARERILAARGSWDVIFSEPSNPYRAGVASLFTTEFYRSARARLADGGLFVQWLQTYEVDRESVGSVYATLLDVFPEVESWRTQAGDLVLVASIRPVDHDLARLRARIASEPFASALAVAWSAEDLEALYARYIGGTRRSRALAATPGVPINRDDITPIEFGFARSVGRVGNASPRALREEAVRAGDGAPRWTHGALDLDRLAERSAEAAVFDEIEWPSERAPLAAAAARLEALAHWREGRLTQVLGSWLKQSEPASSTLQLLAITEAVADAGHDAAERGIALLAAMRPVEADAITARLRLRQRRWSEAVAALERALVAHRTDPWPDARVLDRALRLVPELVHGAADPQLAGRLVAALERPFAVSMHDDLRIRLLQEVALALPGAPCNEAMRAALARAEPHIWWDEPVLERRAVCGRVWGAPEARRAARELAEFRAARRNESGQPAGR